MAASGQKDIGGGAMLFADIFRRADKNDDGALSLAEFTDFFSDGVFDDKALESLFQRIDTNKSGNLDVQELAAFFMREWGIFQNVFALLETMNVEVNASLKDSFLASEGASEFDQFCTRFLLKELGTHIYSFCGPLEQAYEALHTKAIHAQYAPAAPSRANAVHQPTTPPLASLLCQPGACPRAGAPSRQVASTRRRAPDMAWAPGTESLAQEVHRLAQLVDRIEAKLVLQPVEEEIDPVMDVRVLVSRKLKASAASSDGFRQLLGGYIAQTRADKQCHMVSCQLAAATHTFTVFELWESESDVTRHAEGTICKAFREGTVSLLAEAEKTSSMEVPASWMQDDA